MCPSEIGSNFVTGPEEFVYHLVMDKFNWLSVDGSNVPIISLVF